MFEILLGCVTILSLLSIIIAAMALRMQRNKIAQLDAQQQAWKLNLDTQWHQYQLEYQKRLAQIEEKISSQLDFFAQNAQAKDLEGVNRLSILTQQCEKALAQIRVEHVITKLPHIEDLPLPTEEWAANTSQQNKQGINLQSAQLAERDFSHRSMRHANLRNAHLNNAAFFMTDLTGANLQGADLSNTNLAAANLTGANLRGANLTGANLLVTDLNSTNLIGANLHGVQSLTTEQILAAVIDGTTQLDANIDITLPQTPRVD